MPGLLGKKIGMTSVFSVEGKNVPLRLAAQKLPITTKFVVRRDYDIQNQNA